MALVVEDGTGLSNAEAFADLAAYDVWLLSQYGESRTAAQTDAVTEGVIRRVTTFLTNGFNWKGARVNGRSQSQAWSRTGVTDHEGNAVASDSVPVEVISAQHVLTRAELTTPGIINPQVDFGLRVKSEKVGPIAVQYEPGETSEEYRVVITQAEDLIRGLVTTKARAIDTVRDPVALVV